jgi:hypothetical protein
MCLLQISPGKNQISADGDRLRQSNLSKSMKLLQIQNLYMQPIALPGLMSNIVPEKCGFWQIKRADLTARIDPSELGLQPNIQTIFRNDMY